MSITLLCSFLLGLGDSCFNTQLYSILGRVYADQSTPAFAIFKFIQVIPGCQLSDVVSGASGAGLKGCLVKYEINSLQSSLKEHGNKTCTFNLIPTTSLRPKGSPDKHKHHQIHIFYVKADFVFQCFLSQEILRHHS